MCDQLLTETGDYNILQMGTGYVSLKPDHLLTGHDSQSFCLCAIQRLYHLLVEVYIGNECSKIICLILLPQLIEVGACLALGWPGPGLKNSMHPLLHNTFISVNIIQ